MTGRTLYILGLALYVSGTGYFHNGLRAQAAMPPSATTDSAPPDLGAWQRRKDGTIVHPHDEHAIPTSKQPGVYMLPWVTALQTERA